MTKRDQTHELKPRGFYPTPWDAFVPLIPFLAYGGKGFDVIEPFAGDGTLCNHLTKVGCSVIWASDIEPNHPMVTAMDVKDIKALPMGIVVSNPPWPEPRMKGEPTLSLINHILKIHGACWMLLPTDFMSNEYAYDLMTKCDELVIVGRVKWIPGSKQAGFDNCAWYHFTVHGHYNTRITPRLGKKASLHAGAEALAATAAIRQAQQE